jgi:uncharacterized membrane protein YtjA (UPF0391 family)
MLSKHVSHISFDWGESQMLSWALFFFIVEVVAALFGFGGIAGSFAVIFQVLFVVFLVLFVALFAILIFKREPN